MITELAQTRVRRRIATLTVREIYDFLVTDGGIHYFSSEPRRIF